MRKPILILLMLIFAQPSFAKYYDKDGKIPPYYDDAIVEASVIQDGESYILDLPFKTYAQEIYDNGVFLSPTSDMLGRTVLAKVCYDKNDEKAVKKFHGFIGKNLKDQRYTAKCPITKAQKLAYIDESTGELKLYDGINKSEPELFTEWYRE